LYKPARGFVPEFEAPVSAGVSAIQFRDGILYQFGESFMDITKLPVYYIGMPGADNSGIEKLLSEHGFSDVRKSDGVPSRVKSDGVARAHVAALQKALSECDGPFIILEDDVQINKFDPNIEVTYDMDAVYLGVSEWGLKDGHGQRKIAVKKENNGFYRALNMLAAHAILYISHDYARFLLENIPIFIDMGTNQDKMRAETMKYWSVYARRVPIFYQSGKYERYTNFILPGKTNVPLLEFYR
jgi:hypothetical protein